MELTLTLQNLREMTDEIQKQREVELHAVVYTDVCAPEIILQQLQEELRRSIEQDDKRTHFTVTLASYYRIYHRFGKKDAHQAILAMATNYRNRHFPTANISISEWEPYMQTYIVNVTLHFTLPWLLDQRSSRLPPT